MNMQFSHPYKKLGDRLCTTLREWNPAKEEYNRKLIGQKVYKNKVLIQVLKVRMSDLYPDFIAYDAEGLYKFKEGVEDYLMLFLLEEKQ